MEENKEKKMSKDLDIQICNEATKVINKNLKRKKINQNY